MDELAAVEFEMRLLAEKLTILIIIELSMNL